MAQDVPEPFVVEKARYYDSLFIAFQQTQNNGVGRALVMPDLFRHLDTPDTVGLKPT